MFLIEDRSPQVLTAEMVRGRYIEEGLGLTADLVSRYEGTLDVVPGENGWAKAVAVKLPRADTMMMGWRSSRACTMWAARLMASASPTDVPPNLQTITAARYDRWPP